METIVSGPTAESTTDLRLDLTFVEADPPRQSWFACWDPDDPGGLFHCGEADDGADRTASIALQLPAKRGTVRTMVTAQRLTMADAIDALAVVRHDDDGVSDTTWAWARVVRAALSFIAEGRVLPWVSPAGYDTWRVDPLSRPQSDLIAALADALPPQAHAIPVEAETNEGTPKLISDPVYLIRAACDAIADCFLRTPAAHRVGSLSLFADKTPTKVQHLRPWVEDLAARRCARSRLTLQIHPPEGAFPSPGQAAAAEDEAGSWTVKFQLRSVDDPSLVIDAAKYWTAPAEVVARLGDQAEVTLLSGLRKLGQLVPPLDDVLDQVAPTEAALADADIDDLLDALDDLFDHGIDVRWPAELVAPRIERRLVASTSETPTGSLPTVLDMKSLLTVDWEFLIDGVALSVDELKVLGEAKRSVVPLRGRWVRLNHDDRARLKARPPNVSIGEVLAAALTNEPSLLLDGGNANTDDQAMGGPVPLRIEGAVADLVERMAQLTGQREQAAPPELQAELRPYQRRGLAWLADLCSLGVGGCLADDMGLGKTIQVLALHAHLGQAPRPGHNSRPSQAPTLVVCPTSLIGNWEREAARFLPATKVRIYHGPNRTLKGIEPGELVLTSYGVVRGDAERLAATEWGLVVADEAQQAKNPRSSTARALRQISARTRIALTGTPVENRLSELWSIFDWAVPGLLGPLATFNRTTAVPIERDGDPTATRRLTSLLAPFLLRRHKTDPGIAPELPAKIERDLTVPLSPEQATLYRATVEETLAQIKQTEGIQRRGMVLALLTRLKQITNHPAQFLGESASEPGSGSGSGLGPSRSLREGRSGKLDALEELLGVLATNDESTLIFTQYVQMGNLLLEHLANIGVDAALLHGGLSRQARQHMVDDFQAGELKVLVLSLKAGGTGLNLTAATNVVHYDRWWNPAVEDQATDRAYRIGQNKTVTVHRLMTQGTVEDRVAELLSNKRTLANRVVGAASSGSGGESWIAELSDEELAGLVALDLATADANG